MADLTSDQFELSGYPRALEWYRCFDDPTARDWIDGQELARNQENWDDRQKAKWRFFYRPFAPVVGRPQLKMIRERQADIEVSREEIDNSRAEISREKSLLVRETRSLAAGLCLILAIECFPQAHAPWILVPLLVSGLFGFLRHSSVRHEIERRIEGLSTRIDELETTINVEHTEIEQLRGEISELKSQIITPVDEATIEKWLHEEITALELRSISELLGRQIDESNIGDHIKHKRVDDRVYALLVDSWGCLQPPRVSGPLGQESTGRQRVQGELGERFSTWRVGSKAQPIFRIRYHQHVFLFERNIGIASYFYDFVTRAKYGLRYEIFQYNHVTNFSIREVAVEDEPWVEQQGAGGPARTSYDHKLLSAFTLAVASGSHFRCIVVDERITQVLNAWMKCVAEERELTRLLDQPELKKRLHDDPRLVSDFEHRDDAEIEEARKQLVEQRRKIEAIDRPLVHAVLQQIREGVESYRVPTMTAT